MKPHWTTTQVQHNGNGEKRQLFAFPWTPPLKEVERDTHS